MPGTPINWDEHGLSTRVLNVMHNERVATWEQLADLTEQELLRIPNFGKVSLREMREWWRREKHPEITPAWIFTSTRSRANLSAAAPDLLEAVRAILVQVIQGPVFERDACISAAFAAYRKATRPIGQEPR